MAIKDWQLEITAGRMIQVNLRTGGLILALAGLFFTVYLVSLAVHPVRLPLYPEWLFGADSMEEVLQGTSTTLAARKHPLFVWLAVPLYAVSTRLFGGIAGPVGENLALAFPTALLGAVNVALSFIIFQKNHSHRRIALLFTLLYGFAAATWVFSSFPETYVVTALASNLVLLALLNQSGSASADRLTAALNALACYASPQQIFLAIIPAVRRLGQGYWFSLLKLAGRDLTDRQPTDYPAPALYQSWQAVWRVTAYGLGLVILFIVPYLVYYELLGLGWQLTTDYVRWYGETARLFNPNWYISLALNFFLFSIAAPSIDTAMYSQTPRVLAQQIAWPWFLLAGLYGILSLRSLGELHRSTARFRVYALPTLVYLAFYLLFFVYFNPEEGFLYALPVLLPWLLLLHTGFVRLTRRRWHILLVLLVIGTAVNSLVFINFLNSLR